MTDSRPIRQTIQAILGLAVACLPTIVATPFDWRALLTALVGGAVLLVTNPRLVTGLRKGMPIAGSSMVAPKRKQRFPQAVPNIPTSSEDAKTPVLPKGVRIHTKMPPDDPTKT
jgi:hypothetical protein